MLFLESENPDKDIKLYINSPGGVVTAGLAIYDTMQFVKPDVSTICIGQAASMGAVLLAGGRQGQALRLPHARIMIHQPLGRLPGPGGGHRDPRQGDARDPRPAEQDPGQAHRPERRQASSRTPTATDSWPGTRRVRYGLIDQVLEKRGEIATASQSADGRLENRPDRPESPGGESRARQEVRLVIQVPSLQRLSRAPVLCFAGAAPCYRFHAQCAGMRQCLHVRAIR